MLLSRALIDEEAEDSPVRIDPFSMTVDKRRHARCALLCSKVMIYSNIRMHTAVSRCHTRANRERRHDNYACFPKIPRVRKPRESERDGLQLDVLRRQRFVYIVK